MLLAASALKGYTIAANDGHIGTVADILFDDQTWKIRWLVVETGSWLIERQVLLHPSAVHELDNERLELSVTLSKEQVERSPDIGRDLPVSRQMELRLYDYYGWDPAWGGSYFGAGAIAGPLSSPPYFGALTPAPALDVAFPPESGDPHLRSVAAVTGYHILASDGEIGHVENLLIDDTRWTIHYLVVDTANWWLGRHVLVSPYAVRDISWSDRQVRLDIACERVKASPAWDPIALMDQAYEKRLHAHYGWPGYGF